MSARFDPSGGALISMQADVVQASDFVLASVRAERTFDVMRMLDAVEPALSAGRPGTVYGNCCSCSNTNGPCGTGCGGCCGVTTVPRPRLNK